MAKIIDTQTSRRTIRLSTNDIISIVQEYQRIVPRFSDFECIRNYLDNIVIYIPEDI